MMDLGDRMKGYEDVTRLRLLPRTPAILRVDGRAFHTYTRGYAKPWDERIEDGMTRVARALVDEVQGARLAYVQSDEVSVLLVDYATLTTEAWFGGYVQKIVSCAASLATVAFGDGAMFDARVFNVPPDEVVNYFLWRQRDAERNSIQGLGHAHFSHREMHGYNMSQIQDRLMCEKGINWNDTPTHRKRGWCVLPGGVVDMEPPRFGADREYVQRFVAAEMAVATTDPTAESEGA